MLNNKNNQNLNTPLERIFSKVPQRCNCCACIELHSAVKKEAGLTRYQELCRSLGVYTQ